MCPIAPIIYVIHAEPMAYTIRTDPEIEGINIPGESSVIETKISMFADDTQLLNKNEKSVEKSFKILHIYELTSGARINFDKTKGLLCQRDC